MVNNWVITRLHESIQDARPHEGVPGHLNGRRGAARAAAIAPARWPGRGLTGIPLATRLLWCDGEGGHSAVWD